MAPLKDSERRDFLELCDDRYERRSMILTSQLPLAYPIGVRCCYFLSETFSIFRKPT
jgi:hypothetical protein